MGRQKGTQVYMGRVEAAFRLGYPLTIREVSLWAGCDYATARNLILELEAIEKVTRFSVPNETYTLFIKVHVPATRNGMGLCLIASRNHERYTGHDNFNLGANYVECRDCGKHAHVGSESTYPLLVHTSEKVIESIRPQDF